MRCVEAPPNGTPAQAGPGVSPLPACFGHPHRWQAPEVPEIADPRLLTAVHEAGHGVVAHDLGLTVNSIAIHTDIDGETDITGPDDPWVQEAYACVAVAGFAAVGVLLGDEAEARSRASDNHDLEGSDLLLAIERALAAGTDEQDLSDYLDAVDGSVRTQIARPVIAGAMQAVAEELWDGADYLSGDHIRAIIERVTGEWKAAQPAPVTPGSTGPEASAPAS